MNQQQTLLEELKSTLATEPKYLMDGELFKNKIIEDSLKLEPSLLSLLLKNDRLTKQFFTDVAGVKVFDKVSFQKFVSSKQFLPNSYTAFRNKIGLGSHDNEKFFCNNNEIVLNWAYKDCVLKAGMTKEDTKHNVKEVFYNEVLAPDEVNRLLDEKLLTNFNHWDSEAVEANKAKKPQDITIDDNLLIKGNNLIALHCLKTRYAGKIKLIYIDPPYNTGSDSFKYNDTFNHSTWLTFMKNRLEVAKHLLADDGVIFVNIDDGESHYLKVLMDEIFCKDNFVANLIWQKKYAPQNDARWFSDNHDHIIVFAKNKEVWRPNLLPRTEEMNARYSNPDNDSRGDWKSGDLSAKRLTKKDIYEITTPSGRKILPPEGTSWRFSKKKLQELIADNRVWFGENGDNVPSVKRFLSEVKDGITPMTLWGYKEVGHTQDAARELKAMGYGGVFTTPKPERLIERIIHIATKPNDIVLDFFSGSGTTPAVAHKMGRRWLAIEQMEYIHDLPESRIKKVIAGEQGGVSKSVNWQGGGSFVYCELMNWTETYIQKTRKAENTAELWAIYQFMLTDEIMSYFLHYYLEDDKLTKEEFNKHTFTEQQSIICELLNKNHLYVNYSERDDQDYKERFEQENNSCTYVESVALSTKFYGY